MNNWQDTEAYKSARKRAEKDIDNWEDKSERNFVIAVIISVVILALTLATCHG